MSNEFTHHIIYTTPYGSETIETASLGPVTSPVFVPASNLNNSLTSPYMEVAFRDSTGAMARRIIHKQSGRVTSVPEHLWDNDELIKQFLNEEEKTVNVLVENRPNGIHLAYCKDPRDLSPERILTTLSALKGRLMLEISPMHIKDIKCTMTTAAKKNMIAASRRLKMYGKRMPLVARFDEYGNPLPDELNINDIEGNRIDGITVRFLQTPKDDPDALYLELEAVEFSTATYSVDGWGQIYEQDDGIPF